MEQNPISGVGLGVQPWPKRPSIMIPPLSNCPEGAESSFQMCKKPYLMNHGNSGIGGSVTKTYFQSSGAKSTPPMAKDDTTHDKQTQNPPPQSLGGVASGSSADENGSVQAEIVDGVQVRLGRNIDPNIDPKKLKRIISNRVSAQKSRMKKIQYVTDLERRLKALESQIALLSPQVEIYKNQQLEIEENKEELQKMRQLLSQLQQQQMHAQARMFNWETGMEQMEYPNFNQSSVGPMVSVNLNQGKTNSNLDNKEFLM
uniref:BZIP domain-containing protein n=1 Tax=Quercus lobata TaxID=97700 RepID=A0A7N2KQ91_QUELO